MDAPTSGQKRTPHTRMPGTALVWNGDVRGPKATATVAVDERSSDTQPSGQAT